MEEKDKIQSAVKELIYEQALREKLQKLDADKKNRLYLIISIAASLILVLGYFLLKNQDNLVLDRNAMLAQNYEFPIITKSRSSEENIVDGYINELNSKKYNVVLTALSRDNLSEKDAFVKANLLYVMDSIGASKALIEKTKWSDHQNASQIKWLNFLLEIKMGKSKKELVVLASQLPSPYQEKATHVFEQWQD